MKHSSQASRQGIGGFSFLGENLAWGTTPGTTSVGGVKMWYDEINLTPGKQGVVTTFSGGTGHYTQVVWKETTDLGCAVNQNLLVCQYGVGGNMMGTYESNVFALKKTEAECADLGGSNDNDENNNNNNNNNNDGDSDSNKDDSNDDTNSGIEDNDDNDNT